MGPGVWPIVQGPGQEPAIGVVFFAFNDEVALIIEKYLGSNAGLTASTQGQSFVSMCANVKRELLEEWAKKPEMLKTAESFVKAVLRHYKVDVKSAHVQPLLGGRAKLYFRVGRLLQAWPKHQVTVYVCGLPQCLVIGSHEA